MPIKRREKSIVTLIRIDRSIDKWHKCNLSGDCNYIVFFFCKSSVNSRSLLLKPWFANDDCAMTTNAAECYCAMINRWLVENSLFPSTTRAAWRMQRRNVIYAASTSNRYIQYIRICNYRLPISPFAQALQLLVKFDEHSVYTRVDRFAHYNADCSHKNDFIDIIELKELRFKWFSVSFWFLCPKREKSFKFQLTWTNIYGNRCVHETEKVQSYIQFFFFFECLIRVTFEKAWPFDTRFVYSSVPAITAFRAVTFQLLNRFWFAYFTFILGIYTSTYAYMWRFIFRVLFFWPNYSSTPEQVQFCLGIP